MKKTKRKKIIIITAALLAVLFVGGGLFLFDRYYGYKTEQNIHAICDPAAIAGANGNTPAAMAATDPANLGFAQRLMVDGQEVQQYTRTEPISFGAGANYTAAEGIVTFRGNNYRDTASFGTPDIVEGKFDKDYWEIETGSIPKSAETRGKGSDEWSGSGWTGQPLIMRWDEDVKQHMNMYPEKKAKQGLVEVIYATMAGKLYFLDMEDGTATRDVLDIGLTFKGAGALDPRGIPMFFVGAGDSLSEEPEGRARVFVYSLLDCSLMYEFGADDTFSPREFHAFDSSALVDANTDTLLYPGENSILYTMKLNTAYDPAAGTLSINPTEQVKWTYSTDRTSEDKYWWGMEDSAVVWQQYMFVADNAGDMMCLDLNTMQLVWAQDILDDTNSSPVFEQDEAGNKFIYTAPSLHWEMDEKTGKGKMSIYKLNAMTGEVIWQKPYEVYSLSGLSGGVQATPVLGRGEISDLLICPVARTPYKRTGRLVALDKNTGEERWAINMDNYSWSSPVAVYSSSGKAYIVQADSKGTIYLIDGKSGDIRDSINVGSNVEASPAVYGNKLVVGTRGKKIVGIDIK